MTVPLTGSAAAGPRPVCLTAEAILRPDSLATCSEVRTAVSSWLRSLNRVPAVSGPLPWPSGDAFLDANVESLTLVDVDEAMQVQGDEHPSTTTVRSFFLPWEVMFTVFAYALDSNGPEDADNDDEEDAPSFRQWALPSADFNGLWESLYYDTDVKKRLLRYSASTLLFAEKGVNPNLVTCGRVVLLHGPPGTGKTSLCRALAQKLAVRMGGAGAYSTAELIEVNSHSLFSRWFSESGKLVGRLFEAIREKLEDPEALVFVLVDEVESLAAARGGGGGEPSDAVRAVNALLTQMVLTTSNITGAIDLAFVDRADIKAYIALPALRARYELLRSSVEELVKVGIVERSAVLAGFQEAQQAVHQAQHGAHPGFSTGCGGGAAMQVEVEGCAVPEDAAKCTQHAQQHKESCTAELSAMMLNVAEAAEGLSGRALRKLPFLAHAELSGGGGEECPAAQFLAALAVALETEKRDRGELYR